MGGSRNSRRKKKKMLKKKGKKGVADGGGNIDRILRDFISMHEADGILRESSDGRMTSLAEGYNEIAQ